VATSTSRPGRPADAVAAALGHVGGVVSLRAINALDALALDNLEDIAGTLQLDGLASLSAIHAAKLHAIRGGGVTESSLSLLSTDVEELELGALTTLGAGISLRGNFELRACGCPRSRRSSRCSSRPRRRSRCLGALGRRDRLAGRGRAALRTLELGGLAQVRGLVFLEVTCQT